MQTNLRRVGARAALAVALVCGAVTLAAAHRSKPVSHRNLDDSFTPSVPQLVVQTGDSLWNLCDKVTGKPWLWPKVWAMNPEMTNPHWVYPGDVVRFTPPTESAPSRAELVASSVDIPPADPDAEAAPSGPAVEVVETAPPPAKAHRPQRAFGGVFLTADELEASGRLTNALADKVLLRRDDMVYVTFPEGHAPKEGDRFFTYRTVSRVYHPVSRDAFGYMTEITGSVLVTRVDRDVAAARLTNTLREVERGQYVMPASDSLMQNVDSVPSNVNVDGVVVAIEGQHVAAGEQSLVFIDRGANDGLQRGNELKVSTRGDPVLKESDHMPGIDVATLMVIDAKPASATCLVTEAEREVWVGDSVRSVRDGG